MDFVVETQKGILPIQVTSNELKERHLKSLEEFKEHHTHSLKPLNINTSNIEAFLKNPTILQF